MQDFVVSPFTSDTTAEAVISGIDLSGKLAVITGGSTGLGKETARVLAKAGADIILGARNEQKLETTKTEIALDNTGNIYGFTLDLMEPDSVKTFAQTIIDMDRPVDILINNAGILAGPPVYNSLGIESQFATNFLGHALLSSMLAPQLIRARKSRLVSLASSAHHLSPVDFEDINFESREYKPWIAYGQSKTANVLMVVKLAKHLNAKGVTTTAVHPGVIETQLMRSMAEVDRNHAIESTKNFNPDGFKTVQVGAATSVWAATGIALEGCGPLYLEDCKVAALVESPNMASGVMPYALDPDAAERLWTVAEKMLGYPLPLA